MPSTRDFRATGTPEDLALLLADSAGADLVVLAGSHTTLAEFIDHGRAEMPGAFLVRLRLGSKLVDARTVAAVHQRRPALWPLAAADGAGPRPASVVTVALTGLETFEGTVLGDWWDSALRLGPGAVLRWPGSAITRSRSTTSVVTLAVGVVVGVGPLSESQTTKHREQAAALQQRVAELRDRLATVEARAGDDRALAQA